MKKHFEAQWSSIGIDSFYTWQQTQAARQVEQLLHDKLQHEQSFQQALAEFLKMRLFLSTPEHILGSQQTKHGEIAEQLDVHVRNAQAIFNGSSPIATIDNISRNAPVDFFIGDIPFQSKFTNNPSQTLSQFIQHRYQYPDLEMHYMIPRDQYTIIEQLLQGKPVEQLSTKQAEQLIQKVHFLEQQSDKLFSTLVTPSVASYNDVQLGTIQTTVANHEQQLVDAQQQRREQFKEELQKKAALAHQKPPFSWQHGVFIGISSALISATLHSSLIIFQKVRNGQPLHTFTKEDWQSLGITATKTGTKSGITAVSIYTLTQLTTLAAPLAGGVTSAMFGMAQLLTEQQQGKRTWEDVFTDGQILCLESAIAAIAAYTGQLLIPIPIVGAVIGTVSAQIMCHLLKSKFHIDELQVDAMLHMYNAEIEATIDDTYKQLLADIQQRFSSWQQLLTDAFSSEHNAQIFAQQSVKVAKSFGVDEQQILQTRAEADRFFLD